MAEPGAGDRGAGRRMQVQLAGDEEHRCRRRRWRTGGVGGGGVGGGGGAGGRVPPNIGGFPGKDAGSDAAVFPTLTDFPADPIIDSVGAGQRARAVRRQHAARRRRALHHLADRGDADAAQLAAAGLRAGARGRREPVRDRAERAGIRAPASHLHAQPEHGADRRSLEPPAHVDQRHDDHRDGARAADGRGRRGSARAVGARRIDVRGRAGRCAGQDRLLGARRRHGDEGRLAQGVRHRRGRRPRRAGAQPGRLAHVVRDVRRLPHRHARRQRRRLLDGADQLLRQHRRHPHRQHGRAAQLRQSERDVDDSHAARHPGLLEGPLERRRSHRAAERHRRPQLGADRRQRDAARWRAPATRTRRPSRRSATTATTWSTSRGRR